MPSIEYPELFFSFIRENANSDPSALRLKYHSMPGAPFDYDFAIDQIECRKRHARKLSGFFSNPYTVVPSRLSAEQASHEAVASFHSSLISKDESVLDMTAGLGIDSLHMCLSAGNVTSFEIDSFKAGVLRYNASRFGIKNLVVVEGDSSMLDKEYFSCFDTIFIDPSRRDAGNRRLYSLRDCKPDILSIIPHIFDAGARLIIKASPMLDISQTLDDIRGATALRCISVEGECKEVLVECKKGGELSLLEAINLSADGKILSSFSIPPSSLHSKVNYIDEKEIGNFRYLYEPDASLMKIAPWGAVCGHFVNLMKLAPSSHLFVSEEYVESFPGRTLRISTIIDNKKSRKTLKGFPANVVCRNYPLPADELRKKLGVAEGDSHFVYGTRIGGKPILLMAEKIVSASTGTRQQ